MSRIELASLPERFDAIVIGGGITGAGILREAMRTGARVLLVEKNDFASGTSSASSKLVHGGLRYLKNGQWRLTLESVRERQRLMTEAPGLVEAQPFLMPIYRGRKPSKTTMRLGLWLYDRMAGVSASRWLSKDALQKIQPHLRSADLQGAMSYQDARTDDARLVLRLILEAVAEGGIALNYVAARILSSNGRVIGVQLDDAVSGQSREVHADVVINAGGAWADRIADAPGSPRLRPLRGSHMVFTAKRFPLAQAVSWLHPRDDRPIFAYPWEGAVIYGTTDLDHDASLDEPSITSGESAYLMEGLEYQFPEMKFTREDVIATYSGVRPVVDGGKDDPSAESRESAMWSSHGLVNITGGKLTTFRVTARQVLQEAAKQMAKLRPAAEGPVFGAASDSGDRRLNGRLGAQAAAALRKGAKSDELKTIQHTPYCWAELRWAARHEQVVHLDDLLMRRTRIGLVMAGGGREILPRVNEICREELGWDDARWAIEEARYLDRWQRLHAPYPA
ncbi:MAG: glycerol-3-phosphate dehydrogenase/oxidase [Stenotrophobium sp.]